MKSMGLSLKKLISIKITALALTLAMVLSMPVTALADQITVGKSNTSLTDELVEGPTVMKDSDSPTGYTVRFVYKNETATSVTFVGDMQLRNWADPADTKVYTPFEYKPGLMRGGGAYEVAMEKRDGGYWVTEVPLAAGANQYWFYVDGNRNYWVPDPANSPKFAPDGLTGNARRAFNAVYVPYDPDKQDEIMGAREIENPRTDGKTGTWNYVEIPTQIGGKTRYLGVYLPYGYDKNRVEPYKTIYMQHGGGQDASDWMNIGSVPNIMDNLLADGLTEPAIVVTTDSTYLGSAQTGYPNLFEIILPFIEDSYNASKKADDRSFAGLSMGAGITANIINYDASKFGYYGVWSGGVGVRTDAKNLGVPYILFAGGRYDFGLPNPTQIAALDVTDAKYKNLVVAGGHDFNTWCQLFTMYARDYLWKPHAFVAEELVEGPTVRKDPESPTGYSARFVYKNETATSVTFAGDMMMRNWVDPTDTKVYSPFEYKHGLMRGGGAYEVAMVKREGGYWVTDVPLTTGATQYWFYVDGNRNHWVTDPANSPRYAPDGLTGTTRRAFNAVYAPHDPEKQDEFMKAREVENPRTDGKAGTWSYVAIPTQIGDKTRYVGVYLPLGYDENRAQPYKTIYMQHGSGQDASDWMNIGSVPNIMDNLLAEGLTEPAIVVTTDSTYLGSAQAGYPNLFNIVLPFIEDSYNVSKKAEDRSFAGLSMGGGMTANIINADASRFGYYGVWSLGVGVRTDAKNLGVPHILFGGGRYDFGLPNPTQLAALDATDAKYRNLVVSGGHDFNTWNQLFAIYAKDYLWKPDAFVNALTVNKPETNAALTAGQVGAAYEHALELAATGGTKPYTWSVTGLPEGLSFDSATMKISGTPAEGTDASSPYTVTITATDTAGRTASVTNTLAISPTSPPVGVSATLSGTANVNPGAAFSLTYALTGVTDAVYAQDVQFQYDPALFEFTGADSLIEGISIVGSKSETPGIVRILLASEGAEHAMTTGGDVLRLNWKAKPLTETRSGNFKIVSAMLSDGASEGLALPAAPISVQITYTIPTVPGDVNGDGRVSLNDLALISAGYGTANTKLDVTGDGVVDIQDLVFIARLILGD
ncbi:alpha/beta hydrolase-fold protein [Cohnella lupini]|uniref:Enterochelin esterase-like enzyme n=1 Tax=Cohnella lupini TaxID=1294267 RepID=A0A3D9I1U3_9BACL|nr:alpha/beta hydrolase-fold protein [Cohnella lupini]RED55126.1 enterochelin esterase-like enzyme [Cohnella lupini]